MFAGSGLCSLVKRGSVILLELDISLRNILILIPVQIWRAISVILNIFEITNSLVFAFHVQCKSVAKKGSYSLSEQQ
jgi:hypothetical protein